jgi:hypothetical protein
MTEYPGHLSHLTLRRALNGERNANSTWMLLYQVTQFTITATAQHRR